MHVKKCIEHLNRHENGMVGSAKWIIARGSNNNQKISEICNVLKIQNHARTYFVGGTMFWCNYNIFRKYFTLNIIQYLYSLLEDGYVTDTHGGTYTHSMERIFGYIIQNENKNLVKIN
jgi:lipopolysaccharide biosynthesis protein